ASRRRHTRSKRDWSSDVCSSDLVRKGRFKSAFLRTVLRGLQTRAGTGTAHCSSHRKPLRLLVPPKPMFPQDKEGSGSIYIARRKIGRASCRERRESVRAHQADNW